MIYIQNPSENLISHLTDSCSEDKINCNIHLYYIDSHFRNGVLSIAELIESSLNTEVKTVVVFNLNGLTKSMSDNLRAVGNIAQNHGALVLYNTKIEELTKILNKL